MHYIAEVQLRFFEDFWGGLCKGSIIGQDPVSIILYTRPWFSPPKEYLQRKDGFSVIFSMQRS